MRIASPLVALAAVALGLSGVAAAEAKSPTSHASATALAVLVEVGGETVATAGSVSAPPRRPGAVGPLAYPEDGSVVRIGASETSASTGPGASARAAGSTTVRGVSLFGGEVTIDSVRALAEAVASRVGARGSLSGSEIVGLRVDGVAVEPEPNGRLALGDWGYAVVLEQAVTRTEDGTNALRAFVTGLHVRLTANHGGLPAGSEILIGYAEAAASWPIPAAEPSQGDDSAALAGGDGGRPSGADREPDPHGEAPASALGAEPSVAAIVRDPPPNVRPDITGKGYVFPVYGPASFSDDFGYPRAYTGWHHGNDIFASLGAPVLAVTDGTLFSVGWNRVGGWRLWLRDGQGNEYYYAHLSAYSPLAVNGTRVEAGDVIGFVGDSGDARGTPPHLHFEIHPAALLGLGYDGVVNPYPYLLRWRAARDVDLDVAAGVAEIGAEPLPEPGAVVVESVDISSASGLVPGALADVLAWPTPLGEEGLLLPVSAPSLVGGPPGF